MFKNYLKIAFRNLLRHKGFSIINILGLAIGMAVCILIMQYVSYEQSYDRFNHNYKNVYRVLFKIYHNNELKVECAAAVPAVGPAMKDNFPEVLDYCRAFPVSGIMTWQDKSFREEKMQVVNPSFISIMYFPLVKGDPETALDGPFKAVVTESAAKRFFGEKDPIGQTITWDGDNNFEITGVCIDVPENSHIKFSFLFSHDTIRGFWGDDVDTAWGWYDFNTYVLLKDGTDPQEFDKKFADWLLKEKGEEWRKDGHYYEFPLQPLASIHLYSDLLQESEPKENGDGTAVRFLTLIAIFILVIAWVNFINLSTSKAMERAKEVGVRKVTGAVKQELIRQFLVESFLINLIAIVISIVLVEISLSYFKQLTGSNMTALILVSSGLWVWLVILILTGSFLSGLYPAFVLSSYQPINVLKGSFSKGNKGNLLRKFLVVFQFTISVSLIAGVLIVLNQLSYIRNRDLGINIEQILVLKGAKVFFSDSLRTGQIEQFRAEMNNLAEIKEFSASTNVPGIEIFWGNGSRSEDQSEEDNLVIYLVGCDAGFIPCFDLKLLAGRNFDTEIDRNYAAAIINKAALARYGFADAVTAVGKKVFLGEREMEVIGVIDDFNQMSLKTNIIPLMFPYLANNNRFFSMKINSNDLSKTIDTIKLKWDNIFPGNPFDYFFLDEYFDLQYRKDIQFGNVFGIFAGLAIFIACLGLFALASFSAMQRTKEIGVRKVLGASVSSIVKLLSLDFFKLVFISILIAIPITYYVMNSWLQSFAYRITIGWWIFLLSSLIVTFIAAATISYQSIKTAISNPAKALKYE